MSHETSELRFWKHSLKREEIQRQGRVKEHIWASGAKPGLVAPQQPVGVTAGLEKEPGQDGYSPDQGMLFFPSRAFGPVLAVPEFPCPTCCCAPWPSVAQSCLDRAHTGCSPTLPWPVTSIKLRAELPHEYCFWNYLALMHSYLGAQHRG